MCQHTDTSFRDVCVQFIALPVGVYAYNHLFLFFLFILFSKMVRWPLALTQPRITGTFSPGVKLTSSAEGKNEWSYTPAHTVRLRGCVGTLPLPLLVSSAFVVKVCCWYLI